MLNSRYDDLKSGRVKPIPGEEVEAYFREKSAAAGSTISAGSRLLAQESRRPEWRGRPRKNQ
jgi:hypothetical protein